MALIPTPQQERARMLQDTMAQLIGQSAGLDAQRPTLQTGLLEGNQDSLKDVITDPSPSQINTVMGALISGLAGKSTAGSVARGLATGAATRGNQFGRELAAHEAERLSLKDRIAQIKGLHEVSTSQGNLDISRGSLDETIIQNDIRNFQAGRTEDRLQRDQNFNQSTAGSTGAFDIPGRGKVSGFKAKDGTPFAFINGPGQPAVNVAGSGFPYLKDPRDSNSTTLRMGDTRQDLLFKDAVGELKVREKAATEASAAKENAALMLRLMRGEVIGTGAEQINSARSVLNTVANAVNMDIGQLGDISNIEGMRAISAQLLLPYVREQKQGFGVADKKVFEKAAGGERVSERGNELLMNMIITNALNLEEEVQAKLHFVRRAANDETLDGLEAGGVFRKYLDDLSRVKVIDGVPTAVDDKAGLWKYWVDGPPKGFVLTQKTAEGPKQVRMSLDQLRKQAAGVPGLGGKPSTLREYLGKLEREGFIRDSIR